MILKKNLIFNYKLIKMIFIKLFIVSIYLFSSISVYSQSDKLNDTIIALGKLKYDHFGGDIFNYYNCSLRSAENIKKK